MKTLAQLRNSILTSIHGRRLGLDINDCIVTKGIQRGVTQATSDTTGTSIPNNGIGVVVTSTNDTWTLDAPYDGAEVTLMTGSSSTGIHSINLGTAVAYSTIGIAGSTVVLTGPGAAISLRGLTTGIWAVTGAAGSSVSNYVSS